MQESMTDFTVLRHGETEENVRQIIQGQSNTRLTERGRLQAACAADRLAGEIFDVLLCSDLDRTRETAAILLQKIQAREVLYFPELREWHLGELQGLPVQVAREKYPEVFSAPTQSGENIVIRGGESRGDLARRTTAFLEQAARTYAGQKVLIITHAGPMRAIFRLVAGAPQPGVRVPRVDNVSITRFQKQGDFWQLLTWNDTAHLQKLASRDSIAP